MERVMSGLSAMERSKLVLDSFRFSTREDSLIRRMMPSRQGSAFNEAIFRMSAANLHIAGMIDGMEADVQLLWARWLQMHYLAEWSLNLQEIEDAVRKAGRGNGPRGPRGAQRSADPNRRIPDPPAPVARLNAGAAGRRPSRPRLVRAAAHAIGESLVAGFGRIWPFMRAVETVLEEIAETFDGIDPLKRVHRKRLSEVRKDLEQLAEALALSDFEVEWREPDEETGGGRSQHRPGDAHTDGVT
jgi:hypothetical protein